MKFYPLIIFGFGLATLIFSSTDTRVRKPLFYFLWVTSIVALVTSIFFYETITLFNQDLQYFPIYEIVLLIGYFFLIMSFMLSVFMTKSDVYSQLSEERQQRAISEITQLAASSNSLIELLNFSLDKIVDMLQMDGGTVHIYHTARQKLILGSYKGLSAWLARRLETINLEQSAIGKTSAYKRLLIIRNLRLSPDYEFFGGKIEGYGHMAFIPIISDGESWGVVTLFGKGSYKPGKLKADLLEQFGEQMGSALMLARNMRNTLQLLESMKTMMSSLSEELHLNSRMNRKGEGAIRGIAWSLTRILDGDQYYICRKTNDQWNVNLSSTPEFVGQEFSANPKSEFFSNTNPTGVIGQDDQPPFLELAERHGYVYCSLPADNFYIFIRLEGRRKPSVDFEFFYNSCRIIYGLYSGLSLESVPAKSIPDLSKPEKVEIESDSSIKRDKGGVGFEHIQKLVADYIKSENLVGLKSVLEKIEDNKSELVEKKFENTESVEIFDDTNDSFDKHILKIVNQIRSSQANTPNIKIESADIEIEKEKLNKLDNSIKNFLNLALRDSTANDNIKLSANREKRSLIIKIDGQKLSPSPLSKDDVQWLKESNGRLEFENSHLDTGEIGDRWKFVIPLDDETEIPGVSESINKLRVLAVDSQDIIRDLILGMLTSLGHEPLVVADSQSAIDAFENAIVANKSYDVVIADYLLDSINGIELSARLKAIDPKLNFVLVTGWGREPGPALVKEGGIDKLLRKPYRIEQLAEVLEGIKQGTTSA